MSAAVDTIECMFDPGSMSTAAARLPSSSPDDAAGAGDRSSTLAALRERIQGMERRGLRDEGGLVERGIPTHPAIAALLPGGAMRAGAVYSLGPSAALTIAMLAEPSRAGLWTAVVGMPDFGVEAAHEAGVRLDRLVLVPRPGEHWISAVGVLAEVMGVIAVRAPRGASPGALDRLGARLRQHGCALIVTGSSMPGDVRLTVDASRWRGIGRGHGLLAERELTIRASAGAGRPRTATLHVPEPEVEETGLAEVLTNAVLTNAVPAGAVPVGPAPRRLEAVG